MNRLGLGLLAGALLFASALPLVSPVSAFPSYWSAFELYQGPPAPAGIAVANSGTVYWANYNTGELLSLPKVSLSPTVVLSGLSHPAGVAVDSQGDIFFDQYFNYTISELPAGSSVPKVLFNAGTYVSFLALDQSGNVFVVTGQGCNGQSVQATSPASIVEWTKSTGSTSTVFNGKGIGEVFVTPSEDLYFTTCGGSVNKLPAGSNIPQTIVGGLSPSTGVAVDANGDVIYTQYGSGVYELPSGSTTSVTLATAGGTHYGLAVDSTGDVFYTDSLGGGIWEVPLIQPTDFSQLVRAFDNLTAQFTVLNQQYTALATSFNHLNSNQQGLVSNYANLTRSYAGLAAQFADEAKSYSALSSGFQNLSSQYTTLSSQYTTLSQSYASLTSNYNQLSAQLAQYQWFTYLLAAAFVVVTLLLIWLLAKHR